MTAFGVQNAPQSKKSARETVVDATRAANTILREPGALGHMIASLLLCLILLITWLTAAELMEMLTVLLQKKMTSFTAMLAVDLVRWVLSGLLLLLGVMPFFFGRLRLAGLWMRGRMPELREMLYFFTSPERFGRAVMMGLVLILELLLPATLSVGLFLGCIELYYGVLLPALSLAPAMLLLVLGLLAAALITLLLVILTFAVALSTAFAVGNEELSPWRAVALAASRGFSSFGAVTLFVLLKLGQLLLSLCTVGILHVLWYGHHHIISYLSFAQTLDQGETL